MIPYYATNSRISEMIRSAVGIEAQGFREWSDFEPQAAAAEVAVVAVEGPNLEQQFSQLDRLTLRYDATVILVLPDDLNVDAHLCRARVHSAIRTYDLPRKPFYMLAPAQSAAWRRSVVRTITQSELVPFIVKAALHSACGDTPQAAQSVKRIARTIGSDPSTISRGWRSFHPHSLRFQDVLGWIQLDWAFVYRPLCRNWTATASEIGVGEATLRRLARQCCRRTLREVWRAGRSDLHRAFDEAVMIPILGYSLSHMGRTAGPVLSADWMNCPFRGGWEQGILCCWEAALGAAAGWETRMERTGSRANDEPGHEAVSGGAGVGVAVAGGGL